MTRSPIIAVRSSARLRWPRSITTSASCSRAKASSPAPEKSFDEALRLKPSWAQAYLALGHLYFRQARYADAERSFGRAATHAPESVEALFNLATSRDRQRRWGDALPPLKAARRLAPDSEDIWFALRGHLLLFQREEEAFDDFRRFEANAALSARIVAAGLLSARIAPGIDYEDKYLPLALDWPYQPGEARVRGRRGCASAVFRRYARATIARLSGTRSRPPGRARIDRRFRRAAASCRRCRPAGSHRLPVGRFALARDGSIDARGRATARYRALLRACVFAGGAGDRGRSDRRNSAPAAPASAASTTSTMRAPRG